MFFFCFFVLFFQKYIYIFSNHTKARTLLLLSSLIEEELLKKNVIDKIKRLILAIVTHIDEVKQFFNHNKTMKFYKLILQL